MFESTIGNQSSGMMIGTGLNLKIRLFTAESEPDVFAPKNQKYPIEMDIVLLYQSLQYVAAVPRATANALSIDGAPATDGEEENDGNMECGHSSSDESAESDFKPIRGRSSKSIIESS